MSFYSVALVVSYRG